MTLVPVTSREFTGTAQHRITTKWKTRKVLIAIRFMSVGLCSGKVVTIWRIVGSREGNCTPHAKWIVCKQPKML